MYNMFRKIVIVGFYSLFITTSFAATPIATVSVPLTVENNQAEQVAPLLVQALTTVLIRLTGDPDIAKQPAVVDLLKDPNTFLENYNQQATTLLVSFNQASIEQALSKAGVAYWGERRPVIMVWWLVDNDVDTNLIGDSQSDAKFLEKAMEPQGFPLRLPLADLAEQAIADKASFMADNPSAILEGSEKYAANAILVIYTQPIQTNYQASWRLWLASDEAKPLAQGKVVASSKEQVAEQIFAAINPELAKLFVVKAGKAEELEVVIKGIDFNSYVKVSDLMTSLDGQAIETSNNIVRYRVKANIAQLKAQLSLLHFAENKSTALSSSTNEIPRLTFSATGSE